MGIFVDVHIWASSKTVLFMHHHWFDLEEIVKLSFNSPEMLIDQLWFLRESFGKDILHFYVNNNTFPIPLFLAGQKQDEQRKLTVHYTASQHYQENVFIEGSRPQYLEDLHTEAQEGLKILQQEGEPNTQINNTKHTALWHPWCTAHILAF